MKTKTILTLIIICFTSWINAQDYTFLESKNGFRNIKLGTSVNNYPEFKKKDESNSNLFKFSMDFKTSHVYVGTDKDKIKTAKILYIYLITENNIVSEIRVVTEKVLSVYSILENAYGIPTDKQSSKWIWRTDSIECSLEGDDSQIPGYHIRYKSIPKERKELNELKARYKREAQAEL